MPGSTDRNIGEGRNYRRWKAPVAALAVVAGVATYAPIAATDGLFPFSAKATSSVSHHRGSSGFSCSSLLTPTGRQELTYNQFAVASLDSLYSKQVTIKDVPSNQIGTGDDWR